MTSRVLIIDDESKTRKLIVKMVERLKLPIEIVGEADSVESGYFMVKEHQPDIVLLDIQMPDGSGFDLLEKIQNKNFKVIFVTAHEEYAIRAIKFAALDYILKPIESSELKLSLLNAIESVKSDQDLEAKYESLLKNISNEQKRLVLRTKTSMYVIDVKEIVRCESDRNYTNFFLNDGRKILTSRSLKEYEDVLCLPKFIRCHRSFIINMDYLERFESKDGGTIIMKDGSEIPLSRSNRDRFIEILDSM